MRIVVHLSDLHFGRIAGNILEPLRESVEREKPHLVAVSGDLTQRARPAQFRAARAFLEQLPGAKLAVPGNHDVPLYNLYQRFVRPLARYRRHLSTQVKPEYIDEEIAALGVNTARSAVFKGGRLDASQLERVRSRLGRLDPRLTRIVVTHHPLALAQLARGGADVLLAGHLHVSHAGDTATRYRIPGFAALVVHAGTATSTRGRGEANAFNVLRIERGAVTVERRVWESGMFSMEGRERFARTAEGWRRA